MRSAESTKVRERPISFSAGIIGAILGGRKTQTRRAIRPQPDVFGHDQSGDAVAFRDGTSVKCRFGSSGDRLWVRERFAYKRQLADPRAPASGPIVCAADPESATLLDRHGWRLARYMPRAASRILLSIRHLRIEHLQNPSDSDARAEGFGAIDRSIGPALWFHRLWNSLVDDPRLAWEANPLVWVVTFELHLAHRPGRGRTS